ncbi:hypothetical protein BASA50_009356 [Batrachochytrium salamandrivorans]|uniref:Uncharacterized protein n=1 Tax=Batrachochytrium salamandrivorans TaxID=1357716 RepID=A0ABQ8F1F2_9FUNG|nr:hypothetical protein BASA62_004153 [Batrachochytrium salamandrivorans]KAH6586617.1 hypothetical protein BASA61_006533 [Batrachochytrium salamandrivorans]KAH6590381.1 hypothetical protein BASA50_009356 [Batrachochytrium salamandrivorans]KAH9255022.1 hypothetical protein BASA81_006967 [Batrachochytrium salamandrivorans]KAH9273170.1 hypothetical protein BASA83_004459 [Batrachochytrium salamandrivorans]
MDDAATSVPVRHPRGRHSVAHSLKQPNEAASNGCRIRKVSQYDCRIVNDHFACQTIDRFFMMCPNHASRELRPTALAMTAPASPDASALTSLLPFWG